MWLFLKLKCWCGCTHNFSKRRITRSQNSVTNNQLVFELYMCEYNPLYDSLQWKNTIKVLWFNLQVTLWSQGLWSLILNRTLMSPSWMCDWMYLSFDLKLRAVGLISNLIEGKSLFWFEEVEKSLDFEGAKMLFWT